MDIDKISSLISNTFDKELIPDLETESSIRKAIDLLDKGKVRVAEKHNDQWTVNEWIKKAILLYFKIQKMRKMEINGLEFYDKISLKTDYESQQVRVVPPGVARYGSYLAPGVVLMPGYINIGAYVDSNNG